LLVFDVTPFKIDQAKNQKRSNRLSPEFEGKKEGNYAKTLVKIQVTVLFLTHDPRYVEKLFPQVCGDLYGDAMLVPVRKGTKMAAQNQQKHLSLSFAAI